MQKRVLVTGGRAPSALELTRLLNASGHYVVIAESLTFPISRFSNCTQKYYGVPAPRFHSHEYIKALKKIVIDEKTDVLIPTCEEIFYISQFIREIPNTCFVWSDTFANLDSLHNKYEFIKLTREKGFRTPETILLQSRDDVMRYRESHKEKQFVLKPVYSRFASYTQIVQDKEPVSLRVNPSKEEPWVAQQYIEGRHLCTYSLGLEGRLLAHTTYPSQERWGIGASIVFEHISHPAIETWVRELVSKIHFTGQISFDFIEAADGTVYPIECNPRTTSGIHLFKPQDSFVSLILDAPNCHIKFPTITAVRAVKFALFVRLLRLLISRQPSADIKRTWKFILHSDDVIFDSRDPRPGFGQFLSLGEFAIRCLLVGLSPTEVAIYDSCYDGLVKS